MRIEDVGKINQHGWDRRVEEADVWTRPVSATETQRAGMGDWLVVLTPNKAVPRSWFGDIRSNDIHCLASGGGQQGPILEAQIGGQLRAGFVLTDMFEDRDLPTTPGGMPTFFPTFIATRALKLAS